MCLSGKHNYHSKYASRKRVGYKFYVQKNSRTGEYSFCFGAFSPRKWYEATKQLGFLDSTWGFHIIKASELKRAIKVAKARGWILVKVEYSDVMYHGNQYTCECVVAKKMKIGRMIVTKQGRVLKARKKVVTTK